MKTNNELINRLLKVHREADPSVCKKHGNDYGGRLSGVHACVFCIVAEQIRRLKLCK